MRPGASFRRFVDNVIHNPLEQSIHMLRSKLLGSATCARATGAGKTGNRMGNVVDDAG